MKLLKDVYDLHNKNYERHFQRFVVVAVCFVCCYFLLVICLFVSAFAFLPSCSPGWSLAHFEAEDDFELLPFLGECWGYRRVTSDV